jgi:hypothetical protein
MLNFFFQEKIKMNLTLWGLVKAAGSKFLCKSVSFWCVAKALVKIKKALKKNCRRVL